MRVRFAFAAAALCAGTCFGSLEDGLAAWWKMDGITDGVVADASGNGRDLAVGAGCSVSNMWSMGDVLRFDGTTAAYGTFTCPELKGGRTFSTWLWLEGTKGPGNAQNFDMLLTHTGFKVILDAQPTSAPYGAQAVTLYVNPAQTVNRENRANPSTRVWQQWTWVYTVTSAEGVSPAEGYFTYYLNGVRMGRSSVFQAANIATPEGTACLGNMQKDGPRPVFGAVGPTRLYTRALTDEEVLELYHTGIDWQTARPLARWDMNAVERADGARVTRDVSGNGVDLTLHDGVSVCAGVEGNALRWDGSPNACAAFSCPAPLGSWSFSAWIKRSRAWVDCGYKVPGTDTSNTMQNFIRSNVTGDRVEFRTDSWVFAASSKTAQESSGVSYGSFKALGTANFDTWIHVAGVVTCWYDAAIATNRWRCDCYMNGQKASPGTGTDDFRCGPFKAPGTVTVGNSGVNAVRAFWGDIDELCFWKGALTAEEVRGLYDGGVTVDAGADRETSEAVVELRGRLAAPGLRTAGAYTAAWRLVSAPAGGAGARVTPAGDLGAVAELPVAGAYVFELAVTTPARTARGTVTVTRVAARANTPPTVTLAEVSGTADGTWVDLAAEVGDADTPAQTLTVTWSKESGPGGVYFDDASSAATRAWFTADGVYTLACRVSDGFAETARTCTVNVAGAGAAAAVSDEGLAYHWTWDASVCDAVGGQSTQTDGGASFASGGLTADGLTTRTGAVAGFVKSNNNLPSMDIDNPTHRLTVSFWFYYDTVNAPAEGVHYPRVISHQNQWGVQYDGDKGPDNIRLQICGNKAGGGMFQNDLMYRCDPAAFRDTWAHVVCVYDFAPTSDFVRSQRLYINGKELPPHSVFTNGVNLAATSVVPFPGLRPNVSSKFHCLGETAEKRADGAWQYIPGRIDEVRIYKRALSEREIKLLGAFPHGRANRAPAVDRVASAQLRATRGTPAALSVTAHDDGLPAGGGPLAYEWRVVRAEGMDAADVEISGGAAATLRPVKAVNGSVDVQCAVSDGALQSCSDVIHVRICNEGTVMVFR